MNRTYLRVHEEETDTVYFAEIEEIERERDIELQSLGTPLHVENKVIATVEKFYETTDK